MHPRIVELLEYVDRQAIGLRLAYDAVPEKQRSVRPAEGRQGTVLLA